MTPEASLSEVPATKVLIKTLWHLRLFNTPILRKSYLCPPGSVVLVHYFKVVHPNDYQQALSLRNLKKLE